MTAWFPPGWEGLLNSLPGTALLCVRSFHYFV